MMRNQSFKSIVMMVFLLSVMLATKSSAQSLQYVPVMGTYAGGATTACAGATDVYGSGCPATQAILSNPWITASDAQGNLYFSDTASNVVQRVDAKTGIATLFAGGAATVCAAKTDTVGDGCPATGATLKSPQGVAFDLSGNLLIADGGNNRIRSINATTGVITTIAGTGTTASTPPSNASPKAATLTNIGNPYAIATDGMGNLYMSCGAQSAVLMVQAINGQLVAGTSLMYTIAGNGTQGYVNGLEPVSQLHQNRGVAIGADGSVYIGDQANAVIRKVTSPFLGGVFSPTTTTVSTIAGTAGTVGFSGDGGAATSALITTPQDVFLDNKNNLYIVTYGSAPSANVDYLRSVNLGSQIISTVAGTGVRVYGGDGGPALLAPIQGAEGGNIDRFGNIFIGSCPACNTVRRISTNNYFLQTQAVGGTSASQNVILQANAATTLKAAAVLPATGAEFVLGAPSGCSVGGALAQSAYCTLPISFSPSYPGLRTARLVSTDASSLTTSLGVWGTGVSPMPIFGSSVIATIAGTGTAGATGRGAAAKSAQVSSPGAGVTDSQGNIYFADTGNNTIDRIDAKAGTISIVAGSGTTGYAGDGAAATSAQLKAPLSVALDAAGNLYISDSGNNVIRLVNVDTGFISTIAGTGTPGYSGDGGAATSASLNNPQGVLVDAGGNIYVADTGNNVLRKFAVGGPITTFAGTGTAGFAGDGGPAIVAQFNAPKSLAIDQNSNIFIADSGNAVVREMSYLGVMSTVAGTANSTSGNSGDGGAATSASLVSPSSIAVDAGGELYIASGATVRTVSSSGVISTFAGTGASGTYSGEGGSSTAAVLGSTNLSVILDSAANLYVSSSTANRLLEVTSSAPRSLDFGIQAAGTTGSTVTIPLQNAGNSSLTLTGLTISSNFTLDSSLPSDCTATTVLAPGASCLLTITFKPLATTVGAVTGTVVVTDNALNVAGTLQTINLAGSTLVVATTTTTVTVSPAAPVYGGSATATATITNGTSPSGTVVFSVNGSSIGSKSVASGAASITLPALQVGTQTISAVYSGDTGNKSSTGTLNVSVAPAVLTVTATNATKAQGDPNPTFAYTITGFVNGDTAASAVTGTPGLTSTATTTSVQGTYPITAAIGTLTAANYTFTFVSATLTVGPPPPVDFTLTVAPTTFTVVDGQVTTATVSLMSLHGYTGTAQLGCSSLPKNVLCYFSSSTLTGNPSATNATASTMLTISTDSLQHISENNPLGLRFRAIGLPTLAVLFLYFGRRRRFSGIIKLTALLLIIGGASSCSSNLGSAVATPGTYTINVTAVDGSLSKSTPITLTIN